MDLDPRPFESVNVGLTSVEVGNDRFTSHDILRLPPVAYWRNNLTALSQRYNLYFVAARDSIVVYEPEFPFQALRRTPRLVIMPTLANPGAHGYIDQESPHDINHMIVGDLGSEEILLFATDSGNVTAYYTKALEAAIRKQSASSTPHLQGDRTGVRAFFAQWVYESAWGLSIHTRGRMIAVSSNTSYHVESGDACARVTVFAFALAEEEQQSEDEDEPDDEVMDEGFNLTEHTRQPDWYEWEGDVPPPRDQNYKTVLGGIDGHDYNIPSISFVNTDQDLEGKWLLSTDISGMMKMWDIWQGKCLKTWDLGVKRTRTTFFRRPEGGWLVAALDPRGFALAETMDEFCGHSKAPQYHGHAGESYDITHIVRLRTPGHSAAFLRLDGQPEEASGDEDDQELFSSWSDMDGSNIEDDDDTLDDSTTLVDLRHMTESSSEMSMDSAESEPAQEQIEVVEMATRNLEMISDADADSPSTTEAEAFSDSAIPSANFQSGVDHSESASDQSGPQSEGIRQSTTPAHSSSLSQSSSIREERDNSDDSTPSLNTDSSREERPSLWQLYYKRNMPPSADRSRTDKAPPSIPVLHCSASNLRLIIAPEADSAHVFCANILKQVLPREMEQTRQIHLDRLNMALQIPELGVVIVASQIGRCAVCSLTKNKKTGTLGLRVDWTLPTHKQEAQRLRPSLPLLGIATSPIQGHLKEEASPVGSTHHTSVKWGADGAVDGITTTFDPTVVVVREYMAPESNTHDQSVGQEDHGGDNDNEHKLKRKRPSDASDAESGSRVSIESSSWATPSSIDSWQTTENSRRYRLMLTYMDMTVLTYEISRGVARQDIVQEEASPLDTLD